MMMNFTLSNQVQIPAVGIGTFMMTPDQAEQAVVDALACGYRMIDTAQAYMNERAVGRGIKRSGVAREDIFISTKIWASQYLTEGTVEKSLDLLGTDYIDLMFIHQPAGDFMAGYRKLETVAIRPMVNQIEMHPYFAQESALKVMEEYQIVPEAWAPLGGGRHNPFDNEMVKEIAAAHGKTVGQVVLRWNVQRGVVVIPKSVHKARIEENFQIWDFTLTEEEMQKISSLDLGYQGTAVKHFDPEFVKMCNIRKIHE